MAMPPDRSGRRGHRSDLQHLRPAPSPGRRPGGVQLRRAGAGRRAPHRLRRRVPDPQPLLRRRRGRRPDRVCSTRRETGPVNIGNPDERTVLELAHLVLEVTGSSSEITFRPSPTDDPTRRCPDITLARRALGWEPTIELDEGLARTVDYFAPPDARHEPRRATVGMAERSSAPMDVPHAVGDRAGVQRADHGGRDRASGTGGRRARGGGDRGGGRWLQRRHRQGAGSHRGLDGPGPHPQVNQGKGAAIRTGLADARGDLVLIQDADLEYDPDDWPRLLDPVLKQQGQRGLRQPLHRRAQEHAATALDRQPLPVAGH